MKKTISILAIILLWNSSNSQIIKPLSNFYNNINYEKYN